MNFASSFSSSFASASRALKHRNFKLFFWGQTISMMGTWMTRLATSWLIYKLTHSALLLGTVSFSGQIVSFLLQPFAGVWVERWDRKTVMLWTQVAAGLQSLILAALTLSHVINLWQIVLLTAIQGIVNAFEMPARQSFIVQMVDDRNDLGNAIAINSSMTNAARLIGPAIAGVVIGAFGEGICFLIDGVSYLAVIASLLLMKILIERPKPRTSTLIDQMREGYTYVSTYVPIRTVLILFGLLSLMGYPYLVLLPVFADQVFKGGPHTLALLTSASGAGALVSAITLTFRKTIYGLPKMLQVSTVLLGFGLIFFGLAHELWHALILLAVSGFGIMQVASASNTIIQALVSDDKRARVMSYYTMAFFGTAPLGSLLAGGFADRFGAPHTVIFTGVCCLLGVFWFSFQLPKLNEEVNRHETRR